MHVCLLTVNGVALSWSLILRVLMFRIDNMNNSHDVTSVTRVVVDTTNTSDDTERR